MHTWQSRARHRTILLAHAFALLASVGACSSVAYQPAAQYGFALDPAADVDDETIAGALDATTGPATPKLPRELRLAYYTFDRLRGDSIRAKLTGLPGVKGIYQIATDTREAEQNPAVRTRDYIGSAPQVSLRRLRLMAARARCEVLIVADYGYRHSEEGNSWVMTAPLIVPLFFAPMVDVRAESYLDVYVVDVRSGRLMAQFQADELDVWEGQTLLHDADKRMLDAQWSRLKLTIEDKIAKLFSDPDSREQAPASPPAESAPPKAESPFDLPEDPEAG